MRRAFEIAFIYFRQDTFGTSLAGIKREAYQCIELILAKDLATHPFSNHTLGLCDLFRECDFNPFWRNWSRQLFDSARPQMRQCPDSPRTVSSARSAIVVVAILSSFTLPHPRSRTGAHFQFRVIGLCLPSIILHGCL